VSSDSTPPAKGNRTGARRRSEPGLGPIRARPSRTQEVLGVVRASIIGGELASGELYSVADLAETLQVSRTPVREALIELATRGMVRFERNRGVRILGTSIHDLEEIFEIRLMLEVPAARAAVERMLPVDVKGLRLHLTSMERAAEARDVARLWVHDRQFHRALMIASGNRRLAEYVDTLRDMVLVRGVTTAGRARTLEAIVGEHRAILERVEARDAEGTATALRDHIEETARLLIAQEQDLLEPA
jgi:DNA-binding GntR family transcriptional regulator